MDILFYNKRIDNLFLQRQSTLKASAGDGYEQPPGICFIDSVLNSWHIPTKHK